jgi:hypothetical protein
MKKMTCCQQSMKNLQKYVDLKLKKDTCRSLSNNTFITDVKTCCQQFITKNQKNKKPNRS